MSLLSNRLSNRSLPFGRRFIASLGLLALTVPAVTGFACPPGGPVNPGDGPLTTCLCEPVDVVQVGAVADEDPPLGAIDPADAAYIDVVFVLDTTGSMSGLIEGAKQKIWAIAGALATAEPRPRVRIGLVGYRDRGDDYVTVRTELTEDLDAVYADLMNYQAAGGGDTPESVNLALSQAVNESKWSPEEEAMRFVFLVGDAPPNVYENETQHPETCATAASNRIIINTLQCGTMATTTPVWQAIARAAEGEYFQVPQTGGAVVVATPLDPKLVELNAQVQATMIDFGSGAAWEAQSMKRAAGAIIESSADESVLAGRAIYANTASGMLTQCGVNELVYACTTGDTKLADVPVEDLPQEMQAMTPEEREAHVQSVAKTRAALQERIAKIAIERDVWLQKWRAEQGLSGADAFDQLMVQAMARQCEVRGIRIPMPTAPVGDAEGPVGPDGPDGADGASGPDGADGPAGDASGREAAPGKAAGDPPVIERSVVRPLSPEAKRRMEEAVDDLKRRSGRGSAVGDGS
ncbi:MAG: VWA domain-containing protein [Phycisphaerales bacterium]